MSPATCREGLGLTGDTPSYGYTARIALRNSTVHTSDSDAGKTDSPDSFALLINRSREARTECLSKGQNPLSTKRASEALLSEDERDAQAVGNSASSRTTDLRPEFVAATLAASLFSATASSIQTTRTPTTPPASRPVAAPPLPVAPPTVEPAEVRIRSHGPDRGKADILLRHPQLGRVQLELTLTHGELDVVATVTRHQAAESIARSEGELRLSLAAQGIELKTLRIQTINKKKRATEPKRSRQGHAFPEEDKT